MSAHALLGPSSSKRWLACPPSAREGEEYTDETSEYAEEGTVAHELGELYILSYLHGPGSQKDKIDKLKKESKYYCGDMEEAVQVYFDIVMEKLALAQQSDPGAVLMPEQKFDFSDWVPEGFGTGDATIISNGVIEVIDYKHGKGVKVDIEGNPQLRLYGLGAYNSFKLLYNIHTVRMTIVQPRIYNIVTEDISVADLLKWAEEEVKPIAQIAWEGKGEHKAGDHCKFCRVAPRCRALRDALQDPVAHNFKMPNRLYDHEVSEILDKIDQFKTWYFAVKEYAQNEAVNKGVVWPGYKLVEGRSYRKLTDQDKALTILNQELNIAEAMLYKPREAESITALEKLVGKKKFGEVLKDLIYKPAGKPTLVKESDKRPAISGVESAKRDFS